MPFEYTLAALCFLSAVGILIACMIITDRKNN